MIDPEELDALDPKATRTIDIEEFVDLVEIDPIYYDHNYYLAPSAGGAKAYRLLLDAMRESGKVGIGKLARRSVQIHCELACGFCVEQLRKPRGEHAGEHVTGATCRHSG